MQVGIEELVDSTYEDHISVHQEGVKLMDRAAILTVIRNDPKLLTTPILIIGSRAYQYGSAYELINKEMAQSVGTVQHANPGEHR